MVQTRDVVSVSTSLSRDGLETYPRSRLRLVSVNLANVSVSVSALGSRAQVIIYATIKQQQYCEKQNKCM
jgi:flagellar basal body rod protein FlgC